MRFARLILGLALGLTVFVGGFLAGEAWSQGQKNTTEEEVRAVFDRYMIARNTFNTDAFLSFFVKSPGVVVVTANTEYLGFDALRKGIQPLFTNRGTTVEPSDVRIFPVNRDLAIVHHHYTVKVSKGASGNPSRSMKVFYRTPEGWKVIAEHSSREPEYIRR